MEVLVNGKREDNDTNKSIELASRTAAEKKTKHLVRCFLHEDTALGTRTDFFLIFHAILLEAYFSAGRRQDWNSLAISVLGFICAFLWLGVGFRQRINHLRNKEALRSQSGDISPEIASIETEAYDNRDKQPWFMRWAIATLAFAVVIPLAVMLLWTIIVLHDDKMKAAHSIPLPAGCYLLVAVAVVVVSLMLFFKWWKPGYKA
jgi:hypothetical protein